MSGQHVLPKMLLKAGPSRWKQPTNKLKIDYCLKPVYSFWFVTKLLEEKQWRTVGSNHQPLDYISNADR